MSRLVRATLLLGALFVALEPAAARACSVCIGTDAEDTTTAYRAMTAFMTFTPMAIIGGVIYWIHRRFKALDAEDAEADAHPALPSVRLPHDVHR